jgi:putative hemolysin
MDVIDRAQVDDERFLEMAISAARGVYRDARKYCKQCGVQLEEHRKSYGICYECATVNELREKVYR